MSTFDHGPLQTYEIVWRSGHVERIQAHQVIWPQQGAFMASGLFGVDTKQQGEPQVRFHGEINGRWLLVLSADEADIKTVRLVTADEPIPGEVPS